jgi:hypothetical protein
MDDCDAKTWTEMRRALRSVLREDQVQLLLTVLCAETDDGAEQGLATAVRDWRDETLRGLEARVRVAKARGAGTAVHVLECLPALLSFEQRLVGKVRQCGPAVRAAMANREPGRAAGVLFKALVQYCYDAWIELNPSPHRRRNWHKIQREIIRIRRDWRQSGGGPLDLGLPDDGDDCAALAVELLARSRDAAHPFTLNDVSTLEGVLSYLFEFLPECGQAFAIVDRAEVRPQPVTVRDALAQCLPEVALPLRQRQAVEDAFFAEREPEMTAQVRKQHRKALKAALPKLLPCLQRYIDEGDEP